MLKFLISKEFILTTLFLGLMFYFNEMDKLSSYIQDFGLYGWMYLIWKMDKHNTLLHSIVNSDDDN